MGDDDDGGKPAKTFRGYASPDGGDVDPAAVSGMFDDVTIADSGARREPDDARGPDESGELYLPPGTQPARSLQDDTPLVEIEVVHRHGASPRVDSPAQTLEVWTQNRIYTMDPSNVCVRVVDRQTERDVTDHPFLGFKLVGGQHRDGESFEISFPFPRPGTEAVFEHPHSRAGNFSRTSTVMRVVLRLHVVTVRPNVLVPTWSEITNHELRIDGSDES